MKVYFITFRSVTYAQRGEKLLSESGFGSTLQRTPKWMEEQGCGYSLRLRTKDIAAAVAVLRRAGQPFGKVYVRRNEGQLEEMKL